MDTLDVSSIEFDDFDELIDCSFDCDNFHLLGGLCDTWDKDETSQREIQALKRKRKTNTLELQGPPKLPRPRIVKSDFRRSFPLIWAGVFNSADYGMMMNHINSFYDRDVSLRQQDLRTDLSQHSHGSMSNGPMIGHDFLSQFWYRSMRIAPDLVCTLKQTFIKVRSDGTSSIRCTFGLSGTKVITMDGTTILLTDGEKVENRRVSCGDPQTEALAEDRLDRYISDPSESSLSDDLNDSSDSLDGTISLVSTDSNALQEVLQRYLKTSRAANIRKEQTKNKTLKRRKRTKNPEVHPEMAVDEWLSASCSVQFHDSRGGDAPISSQMLTEHHPCEITERALSAQALSNPQIEVIKSPFNFTCSIDVNFNTHHKVVSLTLNYLD